MAMLTSVSGFPEWLPEDKLVEQHLIDSLRHKFELYGFTPLETRAVEPIQHLLMKGETDKEIYVLRRLQADPDKADKDLGLHFDLTVPVARYVVENRGKLVFPFRRYQIQKCWRGERSGLGRVKEFIQADFDIISDRDLTIASDAEIVELAAEILHSLPLPKVRLLINNRKVLQGYYQGLGISNPSPVLRTVDKLDKIRPQAVLRLLVEENGLSTQQAQKCLQLGQIKTSRVEELSSQVRATGITHPRLEEGLAELVYILDVLEGSPLQNFIADLSLARGLDYYTGTIFEAKYADLPKYPSIAGGGRYDHLAKSEAGGRLPGVGMTIGITRLLGAALHEGLLRASRKAPSCVLVALAAEAQRDQSARVARALRRRSVACEVYPYPDKYGKQIRYAEKKNIPFVWFPAESDEGCGEVKDIRSGIQVPASADTWEPPEADRNVQVLWDEEAHQKLMHNAIYRDV